MRTNAKYQVGIEIHEDCGRHSWMARKPTIARNIATLKEEQIRLQQSESLRRHLESELKLDGEC